MARPRTKLPVHGEDFVMSVALDGAIAQAVLTRAERQGVSASRVLRELVAVGLERSGARLNHSVLQRREAEREVKAQLLGEARAAVSETFRRMSRRR